MLLDKSVDEILEIIGHDGSEILWPHLKEVQGGARGFHESEFIDVAEHFGYFMTIIEATPLLWDQKSLEGSRFMERFPVGRDVDSRLTHYMSKYRGMLIGQYSLGNFHAVAWEEGHIYDPHGRKYHYETTEDRIIISSFLPMIEIKSG